MLTDSSILEAIKFELGYPFTEIELFDKDILYRSKKIVLTRYFSKYVPVYKYLLINTTDPLVQTSESNRFKIIDPDEAGILTVFDVITDNAVIMSSNILGSQGLSYSDLPGWYAANQNRATQMLTTNWYTIFEFIHPMYIDIRPTMTIPNQFMVCYEAQHVNFESVPAYKEPYIIDLATAYIMKNISRIRSKFQTIESTFGEIRLNWEELKSDGKELWDTTIEKLEKVPPRVIIDIG
jgi:hypothetical protein